MSSELTRLLRHVALDDVIEFMDTASDAKLALICHTVPGPRARYMHTGRNIDNHTVTREIEALSFSCELRRRLWWEIAELGLAPLEKWWEEREARVA